MKARFLYPFVVVCAVVIGTGFGYFLVQVTVETSGTKDFATELRNGLVESCERNGNPLREAVRHQIQQEIRQRESLDYERFFPNVPADELRRVLAEQTAADRVTLREIAPVNCQQLYPKP